MNRLPPRRPSVTDGARAPGAAVGVERGV